MYVYSCIYTLTLRNSTFLAISEERTIPMSLTEFEIRRAKSAEKTKTNSDGNGPPLQIESNGPKDGSSGIVTMNRYRSVRE